MTAARRVLLAATVVGAAVALWPGSAQASHASISVAARPDSDVRLGAPANDGSEPASPAAVASSSTPDPTSNTAPSNAFFAACYSMAQTVAGNDRCDAAALTDFDAVRAGESLGPMTLPGDFDTLTVPAQLLAISDIERVDRGDPPFVGRSSRLDGLAQQGADVDDDPPFPSPFDGDYGTGNWAGAGNSALLDDFFWMYDDGLGSGNLDCTATNTSGCWGHRHDILRPADSPLVMGAAVTYNTADGTSMSEEFIAGDTTDTVDVTPTWATIAATIPSSSPAPSPTPTSTPTPKPSPTATVAPAGRSATQRLGIATSRTRLRSGHQLTVRGRVTTTPAGPSVGRELMALQRRAGRSGWVGVAAKRSGSAGRVRFTVRPRRTTRYRLDLPATKGANAVTSATVRVIVAR